MAKKRLFLCIRDEFPIWASGGNAPDIMRSFSEGDWIVIYDTGETYDNRVIRETEKLVESQCAEIVDAKKMNDDLILDDIKGRITKYSNRETDVYFICSKMSAFREKLPDTSKQYRNLVLQDRIRVNKSGRNKKPASGAASQKNGSLDTGQKMTQKAQAVPDSKVSQTEKTTGNDQQGRQDLSKTSEKKQKKSADDANSKLNSQGSDRENSEPSQSSKPMPSKSLEEESAVESSSSDPRNQASKTTQEKEPDRSQDPVEKQGKQGKSASEKPEEIDLSGNDYDPSDMLAGSSSVAPQGVHSSSQSTQEKTALKSEEQQSGGQEQQNKNSRNDRNGKRRQKAEEDDISQRDLIKIIFGDQRESKEMEELFTAGDNYRAGVIKTLEDRFAVHLNNLLPAFAARKEPIDTYRQILSVFISCETREIFEQDWNLEEPNKTLSGLTDGIFDSLREEALYYEKQCNMFYAEDRWNH